MKKFLTLICALAMCFALAACGAGNLSQNPSDGDGKEQGGSEVTDPSDGDGEEQGGSEVTLTADTDFDALVSDKVTAEEWDAVFTNESFAGCTVEYARRSNRTKASFGYKPFDGGYDYYLNMSTTDVSDGAPVTYSQEMIAHIEGTTARQYGKNLDDPNDPAYYYVDLNLEGDGDVDTVMVKEWMLTFRFMISYDFSGKSAQFSYDETLGAYTYQGTDLRVKYSPMEAGEYTVAKAVLKFAVGKLAYAAVTLSGNDEETFKYYDYGKTGTFVPENAKPYTAN